MLLERTSIHETRARYPLEATAKVEKTLLPVLKRVIRASIASSCELATICSESNISQATSVLLPEKDALSLSLFLSLSLSLFLSLSLSLSLSLFLSLS
jgi:hypothetical protein